MCITIKCPIHGKKLIELHWEINKSTIIAASLKRLLLVIDKWWSRKKISKDIVEPNSTINQLDLIDIYRILHPTTVEHTFFSSSHGTFTNKDPIIKHTRKDIKNRNHTMFLIPSGIKLEINDRK